MPPFHVPEASEATEQGESIIIGWGPPCEAAKAASPSLGGGGGENLFRTAPPASEDFLEQASDEVAVEGVVGVVVVLLYVEFLLPSKGEVTAMNQ